MAAGKRGDIDWFDMPEEDYRASRIVRALGSPKAFALIRLLMENEFLAVEDIADKLNRSPWDTSKILRSLRDLDMVRYQKDGRWTLYALKDAEGIKAILESARRYVRRVRQQA